MTRTTSGYRRARAAPTQLPCLQKRNAITGHTPTSVEQSTRQMSREDPNKSLQNRDSPRGGAYRRHCNDPSPIVPAMPITASRKRKRGRAYDCSTPPEFDIMKRLALAKDYVSPRQARSRRIRQYLLWASHYLQPTSAQMRPFAPTFRASRSATCIGLKVNRDVQYEFDTLITVGCDPEPILLPIEGRGKAMGFLLDH